jgi:hypothetical protein
VFELKVRLGRLGQEFGKRRYSYIGSVKDVEESLWADDKRLEETILRQEITSSGEENRLDGCVKFRGGYMSIVYIWQTSTMFSSIPQEDPHPHPSARRPPTQDTCPSARCTVSRRTP